MIDSINDVAEFTSNDRESVPIQIVIVTQDQQWASVLDLRYRLLRAPLGLPPSSAKFSGDDAPSTLHLLALGSSGEPLGCASLLETSCKIQIRGMAVESSIQGMGIGRAIMRYIFELAAKKSYQVWCNARESVVPFYMKCGMVPQGEPFDIPEVGSHVHMHWTKSDASTDSSHQPMENIQLDQFLKMAGVVGTGGQAKMMIQSGKVIVNGTVETRRKRKLFPGDTVVAGGEELVVQLDKEEDPDGDLLDESVAMQREDRSPSGESP